MFIRNIFLAAVIAGTVSGSCQSGDCFGQSIQTQGSNSQCTVVSVEGGSDGCVYLNAGEVVCVDTNSNGKCPIGSICKQVRTGVYGCSKSSSIGTNGEGEDGMCEICPHPVSVMKDSVYCLPEGNVCSGTEGNKGGSACPAVGALGLKGRCASNMPSYVAGKQWCILQKTSTCQLIQNPDGTKAYGCVMTDGPAINGGGDPNSGVCTHDISVEGYSSYCMDHINYETHCAGEVDDGIHNQCPKAGSTPTRCNTQQCMLLDFNSVCVKKDGVMKCVAPTNPNQPASGGQSSSLFSSSAIPLRLSVTTFVATFIAAIVFMM